MICKVFPAEKSVKKWKQPCGNAWLLAVGTVVMMAR